MTMRLRSRSYIALLAVCVLPHFATSQSTSTGACVADIGVTRPGNTYNDPFSLITFSPTECCRFCLEDPFCFAWSRERVTGACELKSAAAIPVSDARFVSGVVGSTGARANVNRGECFAQQGVTYPGGPVLESPQTGSVNACCELCRRDNECFSWYRNGRTGRCFLNGGVPPLVRRGNNFFGAAVI